MNKKTILINQQPHAPLLFIKILKDSCREQIDKHEGELFVGDFGMQMMKSLL